MVKFLLRILLTTLSLYSYLDKPYKKWGENTQHRFFRSEAWIFDHFIRINWPNSGNGICQVGFCCCVEYSGKQFVENWKTTCHLKHCFAHSERFHTFWICFFIVPVCKPSREWISLTHDRWCRCAESLKIKIYHIFLMQSITELESSMFWLCCLFPFRALNKSCTENVWIKSMYIQSDTFLRSM